jgi:hypothetical protein
MYLGRIGRTCVVRDGNLALTIVPLHPRAHDEAAQCTIITTLPGFLKERAELGCPVKLLVVDSMAFHYRVRCDRQAINAGHCSVRD